MAHTTAGGVVPPEFFDTCQPFSSFDYIDKNFGDCLSVRRLFSQARYADMASMISEKISPDGLILTKTMKLNLYTMIIEWTICGD